MNAAWFNADQVRETISRDLGFSLKDRIEQARRMGALCDEVVKEGKIAIADFVCPTPETRAAFGPAFVVFVDRITESRFADTNSLFVAPDACDVHVTSGDGAEMWADRIAKLLGDGGGGP